MTSINVIENKISAVRKYLAVLDRYQKYTRIEIENDIDIKGAVERYFLTALTLFSMTLIDVISSQAMVRPCLFSVK